MSIHAHLARPSGGLASLTTLSNGRHTWKADVGPASGGSDAAPDPHDLLDSALAACTVLTLELYVRRKGFAVTAIRVTVEHEESKAADGRTHYVLKRSIQIDGDVSAEEKQRMLVIAEKCPIHRVLEGEIKIQSALV
jgi:putative redox protein